MTSPTSAHTQYFLIGNNTEGSRLWISQDYVSLSCTRTVNGVGVLTFDLPGNLYVRDDFPIDGVVELWRIPQIGVPSLFLEALWFIRRRQRFLKGGVTSWRITAYDGLFLLGDPSGQKGRLIAYNPYNDFTDKLEETDDMCKEIVRENLGSLASDTTRNLGTRLVIQPDHSLGPIQHREFSRRNVLATLQEIAQASEEAGTYLAFDIVCTAPPLAGQSPAFSLEFRTYTQQRGQDHRLQTGNDVFIGTDFGNLDNVELDEDWTGEANFVYATGQSVEHVQAVATAQDDDRIAISPYNRREYLINGSNDQTLTATGLQAEAESSLRENEPKVILTADILDTDQTRFGMEWNWGDYLTAQVEEFVFDCRVTNITVDVTLDRQEVIRGQIRGEHVGF